MADHLLIIVAGLVLVFAVLGFWGAVTRFGLKQTLERAARFVLGIPLTWMLLAASRKLTGYPPGWLIFPLWGVLVLIVLKAGGGWIPGPVRRLWASLFKTPARDTHGSARFGTADYDTARYLSAALGQQTIRFETGGSSYSDSGIGKPGSASSSIGEHFQGRPLLTPDEIMRLGPTRPIVLIAGEPPYLLDRIGYLTDPAYAGRFDPNPMHRSA